MGFKLTSLLIALLAIFVIFCFFSVDSSASIWVSGSYIVPMSQDVEGKPQIEVSDVVTATVPIETAARSVPVEQLTEESRVRIIKGALARSGSPDSEGKSLETDMEGKITGKQGAFIEVQLDDGTKYWFWQGNTNSEEGRIFLLSAPQEPQQSEKTTQSPQPVEGQPSAGIDAGKLTPEEINAIQRGEKGFDAYIQLLMPRFNVKEPTSRYINTNTFDPYTGLTDSEIDFIVGVIGKYFDFLTPEEKPRAFCFPMIGAARRNASGGDEYFCGFSWGILGRPGGNQKNPEKKLIVDLYGHEWVHCMQGKEGRPYLEDEAEAVEAAMKERIGF